MSSDAVARQYEQFPYPGPVDDLSAPSSGDPGLFSANLWPDGRPEGRLRILVAGCGTSQAARVAYHNRDCAVIGIDLSSASVAHTAKLKTKYALNNLELRVCDLLDVRQLDAEFDLIHCTGVLHHMADPAAGLRALRSVLAKRGVIYCMVYGSAKRTGLYLLQDAFRAMGVTPDERGIRTVRDMIAALPADHPSRGILKTTIDINHDAGLVDLFLHVQDRAYSVPELLSLVSDCGLAFQGWIDNRFYYPDNYRALMKAGEQYFNQLPDPAIWAAVEKLTAAIGKHLFTARHAGGDDFVLSLEPNNVLLYFPVKHPVSAPTGGRKNGMVAYSRPPNVFQLSASASQLLESADGTRTVADLLAHRDQTGVHSGINLFTGLWRIGEVFFSKVSIQPRP